MSYFVDLPGYGYAKLSKNERLELQNMITWYLTHKEANTALICLIIDAKVGVTELDKRYIESILDANKKLILAVNKIDKLNQKNLNQLKKEMVHNFPHIPVFYYSASQKKHINRLQEYLLYGDEGK